MTLAVVASTARAVIALLLVRAAGWRLGRLVRHQAVAQVDARLRDRGWVAVMSLRLIPLVPFSVLNYTIGASAVRVLPYTLATLAGVLPGTAGMTPSRRPTAVPHQRFAADPLGADATSPRRAGFTCTVAGLSNPQR